MIPEFERIIRKREVPRVATGLKERIVFSAREGVKEKRIGPDQDLIDRLHRAHPIIESHDMWPTVLANGNAGSLAEIIGFTPEQTSKLYIEAQNAGVLPHSKQLISKGKRATIRVEVEQDAVYGFIILSTLARRASEAGSTEMRWSSLLEEADQMFEAIPAMKGINREVKPDHDIILTFQTPVQKIA